MARPLDEILKDYEGIYFKEENNPKTKSSEYIRERMPAFLRTSENDDYYKFLDKLLKFQDKMQFWSWILETQFSVLTAKGKFLDNLGRWLGLSRPPLPIRRTNEPVVIYPPKPNDTSMTPEQLLEFNTIHGLSSLEDGGVKNTFFPSRDFIGETLVNDDEYRLYILSLLRLKMGISLPTILDILTKILIKPFFITKNDADILEIMASYHEDSVRLVIVREMTAKLRTTGFNIEVIQAIEPEPEMVTKKYGENCWEQKNPYINDIDDSY